ncbi:MAG: tetratricopeptide repeat protein [Candidatus Manganitrophus sp. SB1]|nr:tetratricopeptide repeat protein [Candidatus Manganitrophus morganii]
MVLIKRSGLAAAFMLFIIALLVPGAWADEKKVFPALEAPAGSPGAEHNAEGIEHYNQGHWDVAEKHFRAAVKADDKLAQARYNLALALDQMGKHKEATEQFDHAAHLAPKDPAIAESPILKGHLKGMKKH